jgi:hypothetical protein
MSSTDRQNRLLVAEDWKRIYQSFKNADFTSYDFENLRRVMINYLRENYPEDFNDYVESSEYLALIDMIAFLGQSFAFRVDLNARENFLELAERRESILRLARTLSYNAKRNKPANGLLKWESISTTEDIIDSNGRNISNTEIIWNDPSNANWQDQFIRIVNAALPITAQWGSPDSSAEINNIPTQQYRLQSIGTSVPVYGFTKPVDGRNVNFEIASTIIKDGSIVEEPPLAGRRLSFLYRDDGRGAASNSNGFFLHFRQGSLNTGTFNLTQPTTNEIVDIDAININNSDVWLYRLNANGVESEYWEQVPNFEANNIIYNSLRKDIRNIYNVVTRTNDRISLIFGDGVFGNIPAGQFRIYYRVSNGQSYTINPKDLRNVSIDIGYLSNTGQLENMTITMSLQVSVSNSSPSETDDEIKNKAPATYYTQNRMITAEDYNISPLSVDQDVLKVKAVNRTSSGISRYFDLIDPTGKYSSVNLFSDDGILYKEEYNESFRFSYRNRIDILGIVTNQILPFLQNTNLRNFYYARFGKQDVGTIFNIRWFKNSESYNQSTGKFKDNSNQVIGNTSTILRHLESNALIKFVAPSGKLFNKNRNNVLVNVTENIPNTVSYLWAKVVSLDNNGLGTGTGELTNGTGAVVLNQPIPEGAIVDSIIPRWRTSLDTETIEIISELIYANKQFGLRYDIDSKEWKIVFDVNLNLTETFSIGSAGDISNQKLDSSWMISFTTDSEFYTVTSRNTRYIFESDKKIRFYFEKSNKVYDTKTNKIIKDRISLLNINTNPNNTGIINYNLDWEVTDEYIGTDGYVDTRKVEISFFDENDDNIVDDPELFDVIIKPSYSFWNITQSYSLDNLVLYKNYIYKSLVNANVGNIPDETPQDWVIILDNFIILEKYETETGQYDYRYKSIIKDNGQNQVNVVKDMSYSQPYEIDGTYVYALETSTLFKYNVLLGKFMANLDYKVLEGRDNLKFQYSHSADYEARIDPGQSNLMDLYVLTKQYDINFRQWLNGAILDEPMPPSSDQLFLTLSTDLNAIKAMSDEVIYHPVKYKVLFGSKAIPSLRASFKIIKNIEQIISDNEIKSRVLNSINEFFSLDNWDFGDSFYFSELVAYIMNRTAPFLVNIVIVPRSEQLAFGSLFEIKAENDQIFINGATTDDIEVIETLTASSLTSGTLNYENNIVSQQVIISKTGYN